MIKISDVVEAIEFSLTSFMDPVLTPYFDKVKQEIVYFEINDYDVIDDEQFISIYTDIFSSTIIESYILTFNDQMLQDKMFDIFRGRGKYSRIKNYFYTLGIEKAYYEFRDHFIKEKAIAWCHENNIDYEL